MLASPALVFLLTNSGPCRQPSRRCLV